MNSCAYRDNDCSQLGEKESSLTFDTETSGRHAADKEQGGEDRGPAAGGRGVPQALAVIDRAEGTFSLAKVLFCTSSVPAGSRDGLYSSPSMHNCR